MMGRVIGKQGAQIREISDKSGARLQSRDVNDDDCEFVISGRPEAVEEAKRMVLEIVDQFEPHNQDGQPVEETNRVHEEERPVDGIPSVTEVLQFHVVVLDRIMEQDEALLREIREHTGASVEGREIGDLKCEFTITGHPEAVEDAMAMINEIDREADNGAEHVSESIPCAKYLRGRVIGRKGETIIDIKKVSGARVDIRDLDDDQCEVLIDGNPQAVEKAKAMLNEVIGGSSTDSLEFPRYLTPQIIGKKGAKINEIRDKSGAKIEVVDVNDDVTQLKINGERRAVEEAKEMLTAHAEEIKAAHAEKRGGPTQEDIPEKLEFPKSIFGKIVGPKGAHVAEVRRASGAKVRVDTDMPGLEDKCIVFISGSRDQVDKAKSMVLRLAEEAGEDKGKGKGKGPKGPKGRGEERERGRGEERERERFSFWDRAEAPKRRGGASSDVAGNFDTLRLPRSISTQVIGEHGANISEIIERSGASIDMDDLNDEEIEFAISGQPEAVGRAKQMINELAFGGSLDDAMNSNSGQPHDRTESDTLKFPRLAVRHCFGKQGSSLRDIRQESGAEIHTQDLNDEDCEVTISGDVEAIAMGKALIQDLLENIIIDSITIQRKDVGRVIGNRGATVNEIQDRTGARVDVADPHSTSEMSVLKITGTQAEVEDAKEKIADLLLTSGSPQETSFKRSSEVEDDQRKRRRRHGWDEEAAPRQPLTRGSGGIDPTLFISDLPGGISEQEVIDLHHELGLSRGELPINVKFIPSKDDDCSLCINRYRYGVDQARILALLHGKLVTLRGGAKRKLKVKVAKPAQWMIEEGLAPANVPEDDGNDRNRHVQLTQVPIEFTQADLERVHADCGFEAGDYPTFVRFMVAKFREEGIKAITNQESCGVLLGYRDRETAKGAWKKLVGHTVSNSAGVQTALGAMLLQADDGSERGDIVEPPLGKPMKATAMRWHEERGFGFVKLDETGTDVFVHRDGLSGGMKFLVPGMVLEVIVGKDPSNAGKYRSAKCEAWDIGSFSGHQYSEHVEVNPIPNTRSQIPLRHDFFGFDEFLDLWGFSTPTGAWLSGLPESVLRTVIDTFSGVLPERGFMRKGQLVKPIKNVGTKPTDCVYVRRLPEEFAQDSLVALFKGFGSVRGVKMLAGVDGRGQKSALIQMSDVKEAKLAVEDLNHMIPIGLTEPLLVRYRNDPTKDIPEELAEHAFHQGVAKMWSKEEKYGVVAAYGVGPEVVVHSKVIGDAESLETGAIVVFESAWNEATKQYEASLCYGQPEVVGVHLRASAGDDKAVRDFARRTFQQKIGQVYDVQEPEKSAAGQALASHVAQAKPALQLALASHAAQAKPALAKPALHLALASHAAQTKPALLGITPHVAQAKPASLRSLAIPPA